MLYKRNLIAWLTISWITKATSSFYNQPKLCPNATWNVNGTTFANHTIVDSPSHGFFVDIYDKIYFPNNAKNWTLVWTIDTINFLGNLTVTLPQYASVFATVNGDIYFENGNATGRIDKWKLNETRSELVTTFDGNCYGLFIDNNNTLYCSMRHQNRVVSYNNTNTFITVAGDGSSGTALNQLHSPWGIFVDVNFDLYVADTGNNRIQRFRSGQLNGTMVAGIGMPNNLTLNLPTDVVLDADGYLFIADNKNNRIMRVGSIDYYCVAGCSGSNGSAAYQLYNAYSLRFDSQGNIYVADEFNNRIQKFVLATNSCYDTSIETTNLMITSTVTEDPTSAATIVETTTIQADRRLFVSPPCPDPSRIGTTCNTSNTRCDMMQPCQNNGTCQNNETKLHGYSCLCPSDFNGTQCQFDNRVCKSNTCWNNGTCVDLLNKTFLCQCEQGWTGTHCEIKINYCDNVTCQNNGICRPLLRDYKCECLGDSFSGEHCEITAMKIQIYQIASKSFAYVAIIAMISVAMFIVIMDILKYCFGIDPVHEERERLRRTKQAKKRKPVIQRFVYVNAPASSLPKQLTSTTEETVV